MHDERMRAATVVVIGAGQAGLSAAFHLQRHGFASAIATPDAPRTFVVLDAAEAPGGAWQHRWESLHMATVNGIFDLPGFPKPPLDADEPSRAAVPRYFAAYEERFGFPILRPVRVLAVERADDAPEGELLVRTASRRDAVPESDAASGPESRTVSGTDAGAASGTTTWRTRFVINATGTWDNPVLPDVPGRDRFLGRQLHTRDYVSLDEFAGHRVAVVGGGISALQQLEEISRVASTAWYTRREPVFSHGEFDQETGRATIEKVTADVEAGRPTGSVVSYTGLGWTPYALAARDRGVLERRPMFAAIEPHGVREADGSFTSVDVILWATGFRASLAHLDLLHLRNELGGITLRGTQARAEPRVHLIGFGPSQSTVGANRAGRTAVAAILRALGPAPTSTPVDPSLRPAMGPA
ncbi:NAD(P)-binding domain-containing protein [Herbiconiux sp. YIM B11900]|uniref:NAD(P)-binding domain-containing protein n=1 Tax=Herbiconiux sp. YIM B11900 TaxID=3404131 RepID=UPI003F83BF54